MHKMRHPLSKADYEVDAGGLIRIEKDGAIGWFTSEGVHVSGELKIADPEMCRWVSSFAEVQTRQGGLSARDRGAAFQEVGFDRVLASIKEEKS